MTVHIRLKLSGSPLKIGFFNHILSDVDFDWPGSVKRQSAILTCGKCSGKVYRSPRVTREDVEKFARQVNALEHLPGHLKVQVKQWRDEKDCFSG